MIRRLLRHTLPDFFSTFNTSKQMLQMQEEKAKKIISGTSKPYRDYGSFIRNKFGERVQKISINVGFSCPNRDGSKGTGGCTYCNNQSFKTGLL